MDILNGVVKYQGAAVFQLSSQRDSIHPGKFQQHFLADLPQISGDDPVEFLRAGFQIFKMAADGGIGCRSHGCTHVVGVPDAKVCNRTDGAGCDPGAFALAANQRGAGTGDGPLGCGSALPAIPQGKTVLPL